MRGLSEIKNSHALRHHSRAMRIQDRQPYLKEKSQKILRREARIELGRPLSRLHKNVDRGVLLRKSTRGINCSTMER